MYNKNILSLGKLSDVKRELLEHYDKQGLKVETLRKAYNENMDTFDRINDMLEHMTQYRLVFKTANPITYQANNTYFTTDFDYIPQFLGRDWIYHWIQFSKCVDRVNITNFDFKFSQLIDYNLWTKVHELKYNLWNAEGHLRDLCNIAIKINSYIHSHPHLQTINDFVVAVPATTTIKLNSYSLIYSHPYLQTVNDFVAAVPTDTLIIV